MIKLAIFFACVVYGYAIIVTDAPPVKPEYKYSYEIVDPTTGDTKSLHEIKHGNVVTGSYSVVDPDGTKRIVDYTADAKHGFQAVIRSEPTIRRKGVPYSSLYQAHNFRHPYVLKTQNFHEPYAKIPNLNENDRFLSSNEVHDARDPRYFSPGKGPDAEERFDHGEYFKPNFRH
ncbi:larval cuticle protein A2B-like [Aricia agestis]|uniref:larval cuticle protein A2B-like n=1 Tax=Aricia agestis TaxID=91739 RepID=UPI001C20C246|nr:larval cuticle protein A2B-like [Aricia agestis]